MWQIYILKYHDQSNEMNAVKSNAFFEITMNWCLMSIHLIKCRFHQLLLSFLIVSFLKYLLNNKKLQGIEFVGMEV